MTEGPREAFLDRDDVDVIDLKGKIIYFSIRTFISEIASGNACFIFGEPRGSLPFNDEHVIPDWILTMLQLHSKRLTLSNEAGVLYGGYTLPCCRECNTALGDHFEQPISKIIKPGYGSLIRYVRKGERQLLFSWLCLIYLKAHLKDRYLRFHLDPRRGTETIADLYDWRKLHHIHCIARSFYSGAKVDPLVYGSVLIWPARPTVWDDGFDYSDSYDGATLLLRLGEIAIFAVLDDACAVRNILNDELSRIRGPLSSLQLRELLVRMAIANIHLTERPRFRSSFDQLWSNSEMPNKLLSLGSY